MYTCYIFVGICAEYNTKGVVVQEHLRADCTSCPLIYISNEIYLCKCIVPHVLLSGIKYFTNVI